MTDKLARNKIGFILPLMLTLAFSSISFAASPEACSFATQFSPGQPGDWLLWCAIGIMISAALAGIIFALGQMLGKPDLTSRAKTDLYQIIITFVILVIFESSILFMCSIDKKSLGFQTSGTLFDAARDYFKYQSSLAAKTYIDTSNAIMAASAFSSMNGGGSISSVLSMFLAPFGGLSVVIQALQYIMNLVMLQIAIAQAQVFLLDIIENAFLAFLLPVGVVLRCFTPTREIGGILMSIGIGLFLFYPLMFGLSQLLTGERQPVEIGGSTWGDNVIGVATVMAINLIIFDPLSVTVTMIPIVTTLMTPRLIAPIFGLGTTLLFVFVLPAINWLIIAALIRSISKALGEEVDVSTLARLV
jgi:hypothetical protein